MYTPFADTEQYSTHTVSTTALHDAFNKSVYEPVTFVDTIIREAVNLSASDILFESQYDMIKVRARIDGVLYDLGHINLGAFIPIGARIKVLGNLDSTEKMSIQEGQITIDHEGRTVNLRLEIVQTIHGELIVIRIHEKRTIVMELTDLGFNSQADQSYRQILNSRNGLVLVCGPTGCGKTTTLYSTLTHINKNQNYNIMTIEDPVEFQLYGINQLQVREDIGFTFAEGLRTILRLSPDVIFVGEIRDRETAEIAIESGLTGHLVFSTIHAPDAVGTLFRLLDLQIETYLLNTALLGVVAQRLVRVNCKYCREACSPTKDEVELFQKVLGHPPKQLMRGKGCSACKNMTYKGRTGIYEVLTMNATIRDLIRNKAHEDTLRETLKKENFITMAQDGLEKCEQGITTVKEVMRNNLKPS